MFALLVLFFLPAVRPQTNCSSFGFQCSANCKNIGYCVPSSSGGYEWVNDGSCGTLYCDPNRQQCSSDQTACTNPNDNTQVNIICGLTVGYYPDPFDCHKFYYCDVGGIVRSTPPCPSNYGYNSCTGKCDIPLNNGQCNSPGNVCSMAGELHLVATNHQLYYVCSANGQGTLTPLMMSCQEHEVFDLRRQTCVPRTGAGCSSDGGETSCSVTCTSSGLVADPCDCGAYYYCRPDLTSIALNCTAGYHFVANTGCIAGDCTN